MHFAYLNMYAHLRDHLRVVFGKGTSTLLLSTMAHNNTMKWSNRVNVSLLNGTWWSNFDVWKWMGTCISSLNLFEEFFWSNLKCVQVWGEYTCKVLYCCTWSKVGIPWTHLSNVHWEANCNEGMRGFGRVTFNSLDVSSTCLWVSSP